MPDLRIQIHLPTLEQVEAIAALDRLCLGGIWTIENYKREFASSNSYFWALSLDNPKYLVGCGCFWSILEEAHLTLLMIHPDYQGQGLGQLLLYRLLKDAVDHKLERATLEVRSSNQPALSLYQKFGFKLAGRRKGYYQKTGEDALILWRSDLHHPQFQTDLQHWQQQISDRLEANRWQFSMS